MSFLDQIQNWLSQGRRHLFRPGKMSNFGLLDPFIIFASSTSGREKIDEMAKPLGEFKGVFTDYWFPAYYTYLFERILSREYGSSGAQALQSRLQELDRVAAARGRTPVSEFFQTYSAYYPVFEEAWAGITWLDANPQLDVERRIAEIVLEVTGLQHAGPLLGLGTSGRVPEVHGDRGVKQEFVQQVAKILREIRISVVKTWDVAIRSGFRLHAE